MTYVTVEAATWLQGLPMAERAQFLSILSHNLTIAARDLCLSDSSPEVRLEQVRLLNEVQHRVTSYLSHCHAGDEDPGWLPVVVGYLLDASDPAVLQQTEQAWAFTKASFLSNTL